MATFNQLQFIREQRELASQARPPTRYTTASKQQTAAQSMTTGNQATIEQAIQAEDYPPELRNAYLQGKAQNNFTAFNEAVERYNSLQRKSVDSYNAEQQRKQADYINTVNQTLENARAYAEAHPGTPAGTVLTPEQIEDLQRIAPNLPPAQWQAVQEVIDNSKRANSGYIQVGIYEPEYISRLDYNRIAEADKVNNTNFLDILKESGVSGLNAATKNYSHEIGGNRAEWFKENIENDPYLSSVLASGATRSAGETLALAAYNKRYDNLKSISDRWINKNIKSDKYLNDIYRAKGEGPALEAYNKRQNDLQGIYDRWVDKNIKTDEYLNGIYQTKGEDAALEAYEKRNNELQGIFERQDERIQQTINSLRPFHDAKTDTYNLENYFIAKANGKRVDIANKYRDTNGDINIFKYKEALNQLDADKQAVINYEAEKTKLLEAGFDEKAIDTAIYNSKLNVTQKYWQGMTPWDESQGQKATVKGGLIMSAETLVPGVYQARHWNEMSTGQKVFSITIDAVTTFLPAFKASALAGRAVAGTATRGVLIGTAGRAFAKEALATVAAPIQLILHPVKGIKATAKDAWNIGENIANPNKLPAIGVHTSEGTVRIRIAGDLSQGQAIALRDKLMDAVKNGERVFVDVNGRTVELRRSPLMQELPGSVAHATPMGDSFLDGLTVKSKPGMSAKEQGLFISPDPLPRFATSSAFGKSGERPTIFIMSPETAQKTVNTGKVYNSWAGAVVEAERKLPVAKETKAVGQKLYTRIGPDNTRVEIWLEEGIQLSKKQIVKIKAKSLIEYAKAPFTPAIKSDLKEGLTNAEVTELADIIESAGARREAAELRRAGELINAGYRTSGAAYRTGQAIKDYTRRTRNTVDTNTQRATDTMRSNQADIARSNVVINATRTSGNIETPRLSAGETASSRAMEAISRESEIRGAQREIIRAESRAQRLEPTRAEARLMRERETVNERERAESARDTETTARNSAIRETSRGNRTTDRTRIDNLRNNITRTDTRAMPSRTDIRTAITPERVPLRAPPREPPVRIPPREPPTKPPKTVKGKLGKQTDKEKRERIRKATGSTTYNMGKLHGKDVWWSHLDTGETIVVLGKQPEGTRILADGPGSADKTTQRIGRQREFKPFSIRHGAVTSRVTPANNYKGAQSSFTSTIGKSHKEGKIIVTPIGGVNGYSRKPIKRGGYKR